jgi:gamma-glutamylaminecyclotransferase
MIKLFVYGTLKSGFGNNRFLDGCCFEKAFAESMNIHAGPAYPFAIRGEGIVRGELYNITPEILLQIDNLEGHPHFYRREKTIVCGEDFKKQIAWIYLYDNALRYPKIECGEWKEKFQLFQEAQ